MDKTHKMTILDQIIITKRKEIKASKALVSEEQLRAMPLYGRTCYRLTDSLQNPERTGIIAEFKRASPSKGYINQHSAVQEVVKGYQDAGASAISVLTDQDYFKGHLNDLVAAREVLQIPLLRKEFIVDPYQITEAKAYGADVILLIAAVLQPDEVASLSTYAQSLGLSVLLEVHHLDELIPNLHPTIDAIGVNNRNLHDFSVSLQHSIDIAPHIPSHYQKVSESGISDPARINELKKHGFNGFLIGENFMKTPNPSAAILEFVNSIDS
jgi:indole-3-glycerol phosphate synthase